MGAGCSSGAIKPEQAKIVSLEADWIRNGEPIVFEIIELNGMDVAVDGNHPMAGKTLNFNLEILNVREATKDEISHGHVHGPGSHHH